MNGKNNVCSVTKIAQVFVLITDTYTVLTIYTTYWLHYKQLDKGKSWISKKYNRENLHIYEK